MTHRSLLLRSFVAGLAGSLAAQTPPCIANNDTTTSVSTAVSLTGFSGPNVNAYQFTPATGLVLRAAEIFTSRSAVPTPQGYLSLAIWDEDPATGLPGVRLAGGTWQSQPTLGVLGLDWQGASFDQAAVLSPGVNYWLVWRDAGGSRIPYEAGGVTMPYATFTGGVWVANATPRALKWRGYCNLLDDLNVQPLGNGCQASTGSIPAAFTNHPPTIGNGNFQFEATGFTAGTLGLAILGTNPTWIPFPIPGAPLGCSLEVDPMVVATVPVGTGNEQAQHTTGCVGHTWIDLPLPSNPALAGATVDAQFAGLDLGSLVPLPFVFTNGLRVTLY